MELSYSHVIASIAVLWVLTHFSVLDLKGRRVSNRYSALYVVAGVVITGLTGHLSDELVLHLMGLVVILSLSLGLYRIGSLGGGDVKTFIIVAICSPGLEFVGLEDVVIESLIGTGGLVILTLFFSLMYVRYLKPKSDSGRTTPLILFILLAYLVIQLTSFVALVIA